MSKLHEFAAEKLIELIGEPPSPKDWMPLKGTWHEERLVWEYRVQAEIERNKKLTTCNVNLRAENDKLMAEMSHLREEFAKLNK